MDLHIDPAAQDYIKAKSPDASITLSLVERPSGL